MKKTIANELGKNLIRLMWLGALATWTVYGLYIYNFGPGQWFKLSQTPGDWGVFGDYVGGLLNPFFSFLAFIGVIITVILQARQLDIVREQANFEEIQRVLSTLSSRIDSLLAAKPDIPPERYHNLTALPKSIFEAIAALGALYLNKAERDVGWTHMHELRQTIARELNTIGLELETLAWTLSHYASAGGSDIVMEFYKYRYHAVVVWLDSIGLLEHHGRIQSFFKPKNSPMHD